MPKISKTGTSSLYYFIHFLAGFGTLAFFIYLIFKIIKNTDIHTKLGSFLVFIILSNLSIGKYALSIFSNNVASYNYQNYEGKHRIHIGLMEHKWQSKQQLLDDFEMQKKAYPRPDNSVLYRTFDFKWWMFWEYYTYYTTDVYELPLLPDDCKKMD